jgi:carbamoyltransferase
MSLGFNSSAACVDERGNLIRAVSEERLTRVKNTKRIPINALNLVVHKGVSDSLYCSHYDDITKEYFDKYEPHYIYDMQLPAAANLLKFVNAGMRNGFKFKTLVRVDHHTAHSMSIYPYYKVPKNSYVLTSDGYGDQVSQSLFRVSPHTKVIGHTYTTKDSIALIYQFVTGALGLKMHQHEGKVTGLAAYGDHKKAVKLLEKLYARLSIGDKKYLCRYEKFEDIQKEVFAFCKEWLGKEPEEVKVSEKDKKITALCLMAQLFIEMEMFRRIATIPKIDKHHLFLAGGLFANVRLNSVISQAIPFKTVNVVPPMGDEGLAVGSALHPVVTQGKYAGKGGFKNVFSAVDMDYEGLIKYDKKKWAAEVHEKQFRNERQLIEEMAQRLAKGQIIHRRTGRSEFGPRALCNSTTYYQPTDANGTKLLNKTLGRSEYMPYAPIICFDDLERLFSPNWALKDSLQYMTCTLLIKSIDSKDKYAGAVHVDGTARPQVLYDKKSFSYRLLKRYSELTGNLMLINTSWNIHGNPTVATANDSKLTWMESNYCGGALVHDLSMFTRK